MSDQLTKTLDRDNPTVHHIFRMSLEIVDGISESHLQWLSNEDQLLKELSQDSGLPDWSKFYEVKDRFISSLDVKDQWFMDMLWYNTDIQLFKSDHEKLYGELSQFFSISPATSHRDNGFKTDISDIDSKIRNRVVRLLLRRRCLVRRLVCKIRNSTEIRTLIESAKQGDSDSVFKLIRLDPVFVNTKYCQVQFRNALLNRDADFEKQFSRAIKTQRDQPIRTLDRQRFAVKILSELGFIDRPFREWADFFAHYENELPGLIDERNIAQIAKRIGVKKIHAMSRKNLVNK